MDHFQKGYIERCVRELLYALGEDPERPGIVETPERVASFWESFLYFDPGTVDTCFEEELTTDHMVVVSGIQVASICEHHLFPFACEIAIGYIPDGKILGLSKFARIAEKHAHRLQLQERLCEGIADEVMDVTGSQDVAVVGRGRHTCMSARGVRTPALVSTSVLRGLFRTNLQYHSEFFSLLTQSR